MGAHLNPPQSRAIGITTELSTGAASEKELKHAKACASWGITLPALVTGRNRIAAGFILFTVASLLYVLSNRFHFSEPRLLPMTAWDQGIPFLPHTIWIYISEYVYFVLIYCLCRDTLNLNKYLYSFFALQTVSVLIFLLWPTTYPRELYPIPEGLGFWTHLAWTTLRAGDTAANCCPSLHVSSVLLCGMLFITEQRNKLPFFLSWGILISLSTLTTKQHYIIDVVTGLAMACIFHWIFYRRVSYRPLKGA
jgi:membrane-associated phospholipid phosphatase